MPQGSSSRDLGQEQFELNADMEVVRTYGEAHPDDWVEVRWNNEPTVRIVAMFAGDRLAEHEAALRHLMANPDRLEIHFAPWPRLHLEQIRDQVTEMARTEEVGVFNGWGVGGGTVHIRLRADQVALAGQLTDRYGDAVDLTVGLLHYPNSDIDPSSESQRRPPVPERPPLLPEDLVASPGADLRVRSGQNLSSHLVVENRSSVDIQVNTNGQVTARVLDPNTEELVGAFAGAQAMPLVRFEVLPGGSVAIPLLIGTASPAPNLGYATPPGEWVVEVTLMLEGRGNYRTPLLPITVVP
jgi:hypothetical protein